jgi:hypothetical protein
VKFAGHAGRSVYPRLRTGSGPGRWRPIHVRELHQVFLSLVFFNALSARPLLVGPVLAAAFPVSSI